MRSGRQGKMQGLAVCRLAPRVNYLFFADDSLLLGRARRREELELQSILQEYEIFSDQKINRDKSTIHFSPKPSDAMKQEFYKILGMRAEAGVDPIWVCR